MKRLGSPSLIYILRTTSRYNINAPSSSKTKRLSAEAHLHTRYPKHCILVNDFTFQLKKIFQHYLQSIFSAPTRSPYGFLRHGALREIFSNVFRYTSPTLPEGIGSNSVENPRPSVCAIKMAPMFKIKKKEKQNSHHRRRRRSLPSLRPRWHAIGGSHTSSTAQSKCTPVPMLPIRLLNSNPP